MRQGICVMTVKKKTGWEDNYLRPVNFAYILTQVCPRNEYVFVSWTGRSEALTYRR